MPEQLKPCPACRSVNCRLIEREMSAYVVCDFKGCWMSGPIKEYADSAIAAWNKLPRRPDYNDVDCAGCPERRRSALTWTTDPPKVAGWYWMRRKLHGKWRNRGIVHIYMDFSGTKTLQAKGWGRMVGGLESFGIDFEWAGPIPTPLEPGES